MECTRADTKMQDTVRLCLFLTVSGKARRVKYGFQEKTAAQRETVTGKRVRIAFGAAVCGDMPCAALPRLFVKKCGDRETYRRKGGMLEISGK